MLVFAVLYGFVCESTVAFDVVLTVYLMHKGGES